MARNALLGRVAEELTKAITALADLVIWRGSLFVVLLLSVLLSSYPLLTKATSPQPPPSPPAMTVPVPVLVPSEVLRGKGYGSVARTLEVFPVRKGTLFAPSDDVFAHSRLPMACNVVMRHTVRQRMPMEELESLPDGTPLPTLARERALFVCRSGNRVGVSTQRRCTWERAMVTHPHLFDDGLLTIHGVDRLLGPPLRAAVSLSGSPLTPLESATRALRRNGYGVVAAALHLKLRDVFLLDSLTVFAPSDASLFAGECLVFDLRYHVVPHHLSFSLLSSLPAATTLDTLLPSRSILVSHHSHSVFLNGVPISHPDFFHNHLISVHAVRSPLRPFDSPSPTTSSESSFWTALLGFPPSTLDCP